MATREEWDQALAELAAETSRDADINNSAKTVIARLLDDIDAQPDIQSVRDVTAAYRANNDDLAAAVAAVPGGTPPP